MDSLTRKRRTQWGLLILSLTVLFLFLGYNLLRPEPVEKAEMEFSQAVLDGDGKSLNRQEREAMHRQWRNFPPQSRKRIFAAVARGRMDEMRERTAGMDAEERHKRIQEEVVKMRTYRKEHLNATERNKIRSRISSAEGREIVKYAMSFYQEELTARERAELDPLMHEWLRQMDEIWGKR